MAKIEISALIEHFLDNNGKTVLISFQDANQEWMLLDMEASKLPLGFGENDRVTLVIDRDEASSQETYTIKPDSLIKTPKPINDEPALPDDLEDPEKIIAYEKEMGVWLQRCFNESNRGSNGVGGMSL